MAKNLKTEAAEKQNKEVEEKKVGKFSNGDHMVHVFLQTGRKFIPEDASETYVNVQVEVQVGDQKQYFECKNEVVVDSDKAILWNEHLYFTLPGLDPNKAAEMDISIRALNKGFFRNELIGEYNIKMSTVYFKDAHKLEHIWMGLSNPDSDNFTKVQGMLKASFSVQGPNDEQPKLEPQVGPDTSDVILMNAQLKRTFKQLKLSILQCHDLPLFSDRLEQMKNFSLAKTIEVQVLCSYGGGKGYKTEIAKSSQGIISTIDQAMYIPIPEPVLQDRLLLTFKDINVASENMIGSIALSLKEMLDDHKAKKSKFIWKDIIGAPMEGHSNEEMQERMNEHPEVGNSWKGKVLMHFEFEDTEKPLKQVKPIDPVIKKEAEKTALKEEEFELLMEIGQGVGMPDDYQYQISVNIRKTSKVSKPSIYAKKNYCYWNDRIEIPSFNLLTADECTTHERQPDIFIYLMKGTKPIAYKRLKLKDYMKHEAEWQWQQFEKCPVMNEIEEDHMTGMINFRLSIVKKTSDKPLSKQITWQTAQVKSYIQKKIRCYIFQCRGLPPADEDGVSDPQVQIFSHLGEDQLTPIVEDNLNPMFMCCRSIDFHFKDKNNLSDSAPIIINIYDVDEGLISDSKDFLGRAVIFLNGASFTIDPNIIPTPKWHQIRVGTNTTDPPCGEILCSFSVYDDSKFVKKEEQVDVAATVPKQEYEININVLGLRNLKSSGLLPIQKAFIKMKIKSMLPPGQLGVEDKQVSIAEGGSNPNFNSQIDFKIDLPVDQLYCPVLTCTVMDQVFIGFSQPIVGNFVIPIGEIKTKQKQKREVFKVTGESIVANLIKIKQGVSPDQIEEINLHEIELKVDKGNQKLNEVAGDYDQTENEGENVESVRNGPNIDKAMKPSAKRNIEETLPDEIDETQLNDPKLSEKRKKTIQKKIFLKTVAKKKAEQKLKESLKTNMTSANKWTIDDSILFPHYERDHLLSCWRLKPIPDDWKVMFKAVGFNTPEQVAKMMEFYTERAATNDPEKKAELYAKIVATTTMHYRRIFIDELENNKQIFQDKAFQSIPVMYGQTRGNKEGGLLSLFKKKQAVTEDGQISTEKQVGTFKGTINVFTKSELEEDQKYKTDLIKSIAQILEDIYQKNAPVSEKEIKPKLNFELEKYLDSAKARQSFHALLHEMKCNFTGFIPFLQQIYNESQLTKQMRTKTQTQVHIYMIEGYDLASRDIGSESDPYFAITCGTFKFNNRDRYKLDSSNPKWGEHVSFPVTFPGCKPVEIECYDYDDLFGDDLIGTTIIDLDDRFFCQNWQTLEEKPLEQRQIYHPSTTLSQGVVEMWLNIVPEKSVGTASSKVWDVKPEPEKEFELRVSVFGIKNLPEADFEGTTDAYVRAFIDNKYVQETDTHYRCTTNKPNFNYRLLFNVKTPLQQPQVLSLQAWDRDLIKSNDLICEWSIDLTEFIKDSALIGNIVNMEEKYVEKSLKARIQKEDGSIPFKFVSSPEVGIKGYTVELTTFAIDDKLKKEPITIELDIRVLPKEKAEATKVGAARSDPNNDPLLPEPKGRFQLSLNPFTMLNQMCGAKMRCKIYCAVISLLCCILLIYFMPFISSVISIVVTAASTAIAKK